jgi:hypothetical protein
MSVNEWGRESLNDFGRGSKNEMKAIEMKTNVGDQCQGSAKQTEEN